MFYIVFSEYDFDRLNQKIPAPICRYAGRLKSAALDIFSETMRFVFNTSSPLSGKLHFACFDADLDFIKTFEQKMNDIQAQKGGFSYVDDTPVQDIFMFKKNLNVATCAHVLIHSCYKIINNFNTLECACCKKANIALHKNAYSKFLCSDCWNNQYMRTLDGQVEYVIGLATGEYRIAAFSEDDRLEVAKCWNTFKNKLNKTADEITFIENAAIRAGLNFDVEPYEE